VQQANRLHPGLCDIHCHILPSVDDGPDSLEMALGMCEQAATEGIATIVATPHFNDRYQPGAAELAGACGRLRAALAERGVPVEVLLGADVAPRPGLAELAIQSPHLTIGGQGKYMLFEPPSHGMPDWLNGMIFDLRTAGINVILTHPERNMAVQSNPNVLLPMVRSGVLVQVTADSVVGNFGPETKKCAASLLQMNAVHFIATDAHSTHFRVPHLWDAVEKASRYLGEDALKLVRDNPYAVVNGEPVETPEPEPLRSWFSRLVESRRGNDG